MRWTRRDTALAELSAMTALILTYIWIWRDAFPGDVLAVVGGYFGIALSSHWRRGETASGLGLRWDDWKSGTRGASPVVACAVSAPLVAGALLDSLHFPATLHLLASLAWLLVWGTLQQYGLLCFFYRRMNEVLPDPRAATAGTAVLFATFHLPNPFLTAVTTAAGVLSCTLYRRGVNVFVLGAAHAAISMALYYGLPESLTHGLRVGPAYLAR